MKNWDIKDKDGNIINVIKGEEDWVKSNFDFYEKHIPDEFPEVVLTAEQQARMWRDKELNKSDTLYLLDDYPDKDKLKTYRQALRDWPSTTDFPDKKPTLG